MEWNLPLQWTFLSPTLGFSCKNFGYSAIWKTWQLCRVILPNWSYSITPFSKWWFCPSIVLHCLHDPLGLHPYLPPFSSWVSKKSTLLPSYICFLFFHFLNCSAYGSIYLLLQLFFCLLSLVFMRSFISLS